MNTTTGNTYGHRRGECPRGSLTCTGCAGTKTEADVVDLVPSRHDDLDGYDDIRTELSSWTEYTIDKISDLPQSQRETELERMDKECVDAAIRASSAAHPDDLPEFTETSINASTGAVIGYATAAAAARAANGMIPSYFDAYAGAVDGIVARAYDTRDFETSAGVPMRARIVRKGQAYGRKGDLIAQKDSVFFFDARYDFDAHIGGPHDENRERNGQFIASYYVDTINDEHPDGAGLHLDTSIPDWTIDVKAMSDVKAWVRKRAR